MDLTSRSFRDLRVMSDEYYRDVLLLIKAPEDLHDFVTSLGVEVSRRLIGQEQVGCADQGARDGYSLLLSPG
jgi:hypothetical protein